MMSRYFTNGAFTANFGCIDVHVTAFPVRSVLRHIPGVGHRYSVRVQIGVGILSEPVHYTRHSLRSDQVLRLLRQVAASGDFIDALPCG